MVDSLGHAFEKILHITFMLSITYAKQKSYPYPMMVSIHIDFAQWKIMA